MGEPRVSQHCTCTVARSAPTVCTCSVSIDAIYHDVSICVSMFYDDVIAYHDTMIT